ncbi:MAG: M28 family metallopeptidase [Proteobacteria bacterium]|nr:M28 family metallopeptidase [Pseudomonadota bacterium]
MLRQIMLGLLACALPSFAACAVENNPQIEAIVAGISPQRIEARIRRLAAFHTRHTLSDTSSETRGIGAARRWIKAELDQCGREAGGRLKVSFDTFMQPASRRIPQAVEITNVVAVLPGTQAAALERYYVVSGHYDSRATDVMDAVSDAPGANDDASGVAAMMEMACVMAAQRFDATLVFMAVAGEEQGLFGSTHWAEQAEKQGLHVSGMITNDIIGSSTADDGKRDDRSVRLFANGLPALLAAQSSAATDGFAPRARKELKAITQSGGEFDTPTHQLGRYLKEIGERYVPGFTVKLIPRPDRFLRGGDHLPFLERGYAAVRFTEPAEDYRHQHQDIRNDKGVQYGDLPEFVDFSYVAQVTRVNAAGLASLALSPAVPQEVGIEVSELENDTSLRWRANTEPDLAGYRILWREPGEALWRYSTDVGKATRHTLKGISKDNFIFGVAAIDRDGNSSPAGFPRPWRPN